jgi:nicotinamidase-related amidase
MTPTSIAAAAGALLLASLATPSIADVVSDWSTAAIPAPPELKEVTVDPATTAVLFLDMMKAGCSARPRCVAAIPNIKRLHDMARAHNMVVWYSLVGAGGKATPDDVVDPGIKPRPGEWYRQGGADKFQGSTLQPILRQAGIKTVIICGNSFQGAAMGTAIEAAQRNFKIILPVDCSAAENEYNEQYALVHLTETGPVNVRSSVTPTRTTMIKFQ